ncbi:MAG: hypothetical protein WBW81_10155 [Methylocella sp.]
MVADRDVPHAKIDFDPHHHPSPFRYQLRYQSKIDAWLPLTRAIDQWPARSLSVVFAARYDKLGYVGNLIHAA